ncbi:hypothetical protein Hypma_014481 [Hypsizygus marmoreus]|uniref:RNA-directed DNA polymerase n=1 Tax=Hypsizygus marmoreus TaxID=39966 RepID=A0A369J9T9_HYPMA|nr:hypothetical protein Hypma_014481 [Hypsizygus marmoreus]
MVTSTPPAKAPGPKPVGRRGSGIGGNKGKGRGAPPPPRATIEEIVDVDAPRPLPPGTPLRPVLREVKADPLATKGSKPKKKVLTPITSSAEETAAGDTSTLSSSVRSSPSSATAVAATSVLYRTGSSNSQSGSIVSHYESAGGRSPSAAPSLASLQRVSPSPAPTASAITEPGTVIPEDPRLSFPLIFDNAHYSIVLRDEPLQYSNFHYHPVYSPWVDEDPLAEFGAVDGFLPGRSLEESTLVRNLLIRWTAPHNDLIWMSLREAIASFIEYKPHPSGIMAYTDATNPTRTYFALNQGRLEEFGHIVLATEQILNGVSLYIYRDKPNRFKLDPGFKFIKLIGWHTMRDEILLTIELLQTRISVAVKHIENFFEGIKRTFLSNYDNESVSSLDSTRTSIRSTFGVYSPRTELAKLSQRPNYKTNPERNLVQTQMSLLGPLPQAPEQFYRHRSSKDPFPLDLFRPLSRVGSYPQSDNANPATRLTTSSLPPLTAPSVEGTSITTALQNKNIRFKLPSSISSIAKNHPVSALPGMGHLTTLDQLNAAAQNPLTVPTTYEVRMGGHRDYLSASGAYWTSSQFPDLSGNQKKREDPPHIGNPIGTVRSHQSQHVPLGIGLPSGGVPGRNYQANNGGLNPPKNNNPGRGLQDEGPPGNNYPGNDPPRNEPPRGGVPGNGFPDRGPPGGGIPGYGPPGGGFPGGGNPPGGGFPGGGNPPGGGFPGGGNPPGNGPPGGGNPPGNGPPGGGNPPGGGPPGGGGHGIGNPAGPPQGNDPPPGGGDGGGPPPGGNPPGPNEYPNRRPYYDENYVEDWQLNHKLNLTSVPFWDGKGKTALNYLSDMGNLARLGDRMRRDLAELAPLKWTGSIKSWWDVLPDDNRVYLAQDWHVMLLAIRQHFLDDGWVKNRTFEFEEMKFRQQGHEREYPTEFLERRIRYHTFLFPDDEDGPTLIARVLRTAPTEWGNILNSEACPSIFVLLQTAKRMGESLIGSWQISESLRDSTKPSGSSRSRQYRNRPRNANNAELDSISEEDISPDNADSTESKDAHYSKAKARGSGSSKKPPSKTSWPEGKTVNGYSFTRDDSVESIRQPNGGCYICTSPKHFARDCPHYGKWDSLRNAHLIDIDVDPEELANQDRMYIAMLAEMKTDRDDYDMSEKNTTKEVHVVSALETGAFSLHARPHYGVNRNARRFIKHLDKGKTPERQTNGKAVSSAPAPSETTIPTVVPAVRARSHPEGYGSLGTKALHIKARLASLDNEPIQARLDSGADITLMSEDYWSKLQLPKPKEGLRIKLYQLTGQARVLGYVKTTLFAQATDDTIISFELEAYIVRDMRVPLLIGEDFQTSYELGLKRYATGHCEVKVGRSNRIIPASSAQSVDLGFEIRRAYTAKSFIRAKTIRRGRVKARGFGKEPPPVTVVEDVLIAAESVHNVKVSGTFEGRDEWIVEKIVIGNDEANIMAAPTTWISSAHPYLAIANPSKRPMYVRAGDIVGHLHDPAEFADTPTTEEDKEKYAASAEALRTVIQGTLRAQDLGNAGTNQPGSTNDQLEDDQDWGPKTTALPDDDLTGDVAELVNLGPDIPDEIKPRLAQVLRKNANAFGVNGRLGHVSAKVNVPLKPGTQPISVPMYGASPAKREVIDKQVNAWFEAGVIEPSASPWGFPVVVVYRNGKPRLVVDYRKLNAQTIPDEFPIPRQSEIIQALSGSQILSSFDALAGFTQLEMAEEAKEKTAFRCHLGLWQFKRMPFGLRNGPSIFQRIMQGVLAPFLWLFTLVYIDDIVVFSKSWDEHLVHLDKVLSAISAAGITLSPPKCFVGYSSILLLGQKVSRLGLSTHQEKVSAILDLVRPKSIHDLQKFLGMAVYFSSYIPFYSLIAAPLFALLRKGVKWTWRAEQEIAFQQVKDALASAPVLGHPIQGSPYRLYTDASDIALGASLQQVQPMLIADLIGTPAYDRLRKAWDAGLPPPSLIPSLAKEIAETPQTPPQWGPSFDETTVYVERVIAYWSRTFSSAERNYSATEREALGAKEALVKFQPFIEGETIILVTDHAALQWARVYENTNRRLAAWGAVYAAYPGLKIVHRPGRIHSNVDPLSRLPRIPPHNSPLRDDITPIIPDERKQNLAQNAEDKGSHSPAKRAAFIVWWWEDVIDKYSFAVQTRRQKAMDSDEHQPEQGMIDPKDSEEIPASSDNELPFPNGDHWTYPSNIKPPSTLAEEPEHRPHLLVSMSPELVQKFIDGYPLDEFLRKKYPLEAPNPEKILTPSHFQRGKNGLLYFIDADWTHRLCVPKNMINYVLRWVHDSPFESAHAGPRRFLARLKELFYWSTMAKDVVVYSATCDVCQKIKIDRRKKMGGLRPAHIPNRPFATVSLDMITGLPPSGEEKYTAILAIVDKLTKFAIIIPTHDELSQGGFAKLFVERVANVYGLPERIIADRDKRWATAFWKSVVERYGSIMALSSSHHPQTDGQTEVLNATLEQMLRAYVATDRTSWARWLSEIAFAYNSAVHSSTTYSPNFLLMGYKPQSTTGVVAPSNDPVDRPYLPSQKGEEFVAELEMHRQAARDALVLAQERQAKAYNKGRIPLKEFSEGDLVLVNPHTMKLVDAQGTGRKLIQRSIGPFEVLEKVNPMVYRLRLPDTYPMHPVINLEHLKLYRPSEPELGERTILPPTRDFIASEEYEVEAILGHRFTGRKSGNRRLFLVRWKGYDATEDSWVSEYDIRNAPLLKREYLHMIKTT